MMVMNNERHFIFIEIIFRKYVLMEDSEEVIWNTLEKIFLHLHHFHENLMSLSWNGGTCSRKEFFSVLHIISTQQPGVPATESLHDTVDC